MSRRFVQNLSDQETVNEIFLVSEKQLRPNRSGNLYLQVRLSDRTGSVGARMWNATEETYRSFENGDYLRVEGTTQVYQGALQMILTKLRKAPSDEVDPADFMQMTDAQLDALLGEVAERLRGLGGEPLRQLAECFLGDEEFMKAFAAAPAGVKHHHAYRGGLLQHVAQMMQTAEIVAGHYPQVDADLLTFGVFLHDAGKIQELGYDRELSYTDAGQLLGHVILGVSILEEKIRAAEEMAGEPFPSDLALRLKHMIVSHQGAYEFGSPKLPMTIEAVVLHALDELDARVHAFEALINDDANVDSDWTTYHPHLGRKIFKPGLAKAAEPVAAN